MLKDHIDSAASSRLRSSTAIALALHSSVPTVRIPVCHVDSILCLDIGPEIGEVKIAVALM